MSFIFVFSKHLSIVFLFILIIEISFIKTDIFPLRRLISCSGGYYLYGGQCYICKAGQYAPKGYNSCLNCPAGSYSSEGASKCTKCPGGTFSKAGSSYCTKCEKGTYS
jgi:hypothetical protein